jgi:hypothetical protein
MVLLVLRQHSEGVCPPGKLIPWKPAMMGRAPRVPVDLQAVTRDVKARVRRVVGDLEAIEQQQDPIFASPRDVFLELVLSIHELEAAAAKMRKAWWPPP